MMAGLRERQKADRNRRILEAASTLFGQVGYDAARIDAIAAMAEISVGTFYNYFETKADLLLAIVTMEVEEVLSQGEMVVEAPPDTGLAALTRLIETYYDHSLVYLSKPMWRAAMAMVIQQPETPFSRRYRELDAALATQLCGMVDVLRKRGDFRSDIDPAAVGEILFNDLNALFAEFILDESQELGRMKARLHAHLTSLTGLLLTPE